MKKLLLLLLIPLFLQARPVALTVRGGVNLAGTVGSDAAAGGYTRSPEPGFLIGAGAEYRIKQFAIGTELLFTQKGVRFMESENVGVSVELDYLELPIMVQYRATRGELIIAPSLGLAPALLLNNQAYLYLNGEKEKIETRKIAERDLGIVAGFSLGRALPIGEAAIDFRGTLGILSNDGSGNDERDFNGVFTMSAVYRFRLP